MTVEEPAGVVHRGYESVEVDEVEQFLRETYTDIALRRPGADQPPVRFRHDTSATPELSVNRLRSSLHFDGEAAPLTDILLVDVRRGRLSSTTRRWGEVRIAAGELTLAPTGNEFRNVVEPGGSGDSELDIVVLDAVRVAEYAAHTCGLAPLGVEFTAASPLSPEQGAHWRDTVAHVRDDILARPEVAASPLVLDSAFRLLAAALLCTFPNTALAAMSDPHTPTVTGGVGEATVREAVDYLRARAGTPVGPGDLADAVDTPYPDVVEGLRRREIHPARVLWQTRLRGAYRDLRDTDPATGASVAAIAARWGFADLRTFTASYTRAMNGETPEHTRARDH